MISLADFGLYTVKESGRNGWAGLVPAPGLDPRVPVQELAREIEARVNRGDVQLVTSRPMEAGADLRSFDEHYSHVDAVAWVKPEDT